MHTSFSKSSYQLYKFLAQTNLQTLRFRRWEKLSEVVPLSEVTPVYRYILKCTQIHPIPQCSPENSCGAPWPDEGCSNVNATGENDVYRMAGHSQGDQISEFQKIVREILSGLSHENMSDVTHYTSVYYVSKYISSTC